MNKLLFTTAVIALVASVQYPSAAHAARRLECNRSLPDTKLPFESCQGVSVKASMKTPEVKSKPSPGPGPGPDPDPKPPGPTPDPGCDDNNHPNNGHGNDADGNDNSNPGHSNDSNDNTDDDGSPGHSNDSHGGDHSHGHDK